MKITCESKNASQTKKIGELLAEEIIRTRRQKEKKAFILGLIGDLGGGKTTFLQGFAKGLGIREKITSPTFVILKRFEIPNRGLKNFYHIDCYRIRESKEILSLGLEKIVDNPENIIAVEWVERIKKILPKNIIILKFDFIARSKRRIVIICNN